MEDNYCARCCSLLLARIKTLDECLFFANQQIENVRTGDKEREQETQASLSRESNRVSQAYTDWTEHRTKEHA